MGIEAGTRAPLSFDEGAVKSFAEKLAAAFIAMPPMNSAHALDLTAGIIGGIFKEGAQARGVRNIDWSKLLGAANGDFVEECRDRQLSQKPFNAEESVKLYLASLARVWNSPRVQF
ncbi:MAG: hypothetical protein RIQ56_1017 [Candidatus Parcubacteria bacterium]|jgi:hypothetical protein